MHHEMKLSSQQISEFHANGFIIMRDFASHQLCDAIHAKAEDHLQRKLAPYESEEEYQQRDNTTLTIRRLRQVYDREEIFSQWMTNKDIRPILVQLLGEKPRLLLAHHNSIMTKQPYRSTVTSWHQDIRYWRYANDKLLSVWLSLGDENLNNGMLEFIPGSHLMNFTADQFDDRSTFRDDLEKNQKIILNRVHSDLGKGDIVIFHSRTLHYAHKNESDKTKFAFVYSLRAASNLPIKNTRSDFKEIEL